MLKEGLRLFPVLPLGCNQKKYKNSENVHISFGPLPLKGIVNKKIVNIVQSLTPPTYWYGILDIYLV